MTYIYAAFLQEGGLKIGMVDAGSEMEASAKAARSISGVIKSLHCTLAGIGLNECLQREREYQNKKWGADRRHEVGAWIALAEEYLMLARSKWAHSSEDTSALHELRKAAAVLIACFEEHGVPERVTKP